MLETCIFPHSLDRCSSTWDLHAFTQVLHITKHICNVSVFQSFFNACSKCSFWPLFKLFNVTIRILGGCSCARIHARLPCCYRPPFCFFLLGLGLYLRVFLFFFFYWKIQLLYYTDVICNAKIIYTDIIYNSSMHIFNINYYIAYITLQIQITSIRSLIFTTQY